MSGQHRQAVGADLVGEVAVQGDPIGANEYRIDSTALHQHCRHAVGDQGAGYAGMLQFPGRQPCALQERSRFVDKDMDLLALLVSAFDHPEGGADAGSAQAARRTMG